MNQISHFTYDMNLKLFNVELWLLIERKFSIS